MSSFLNGFEKENYKDTQASRKTTAKNNGEPKVIPADMLEAGKKVSKQQPTLRSDGRKSHRSVDQPDYHKRDGDVEVDKNYRKKKFIKYGAIGGSAVAVCLIAVLAFFLMNQVPVKSLVNTPVNEAKTWALQNNINLETEYAYNNEYDEHVVAAQDIPADSNIQKGSTIKVTVSKGPNPDEAIKIPDFSKMNASQIDEWITKNKAVNVKLVKQFDENIANGSFIKMEYKDPAVTAATYKRKDVLTVYVSKGKEVFEKNINVPDFSNKTEAEVQNWAKENMIEMTFEKAGSETVAEGMVVSQSIKAGEKVAKKDKMTVTLSLGKAAKVPWFGNATSQNASDLGAQNGLQVLVRTEYSTSVGYGQLIWQSIESGRYLYGENKKVEVVYSEGRPYMSLVGQKENAVAPYFFDFKSKGANITYNIKYVDSDQPKGTVVWTSKDSQYLDLNDHIEVHVAK